MKARFIIGVILATALVPACAQSPKPPATVRVPDAATALSIAEPALIKVYGKETIDYERPFTAELRNGVWLVFGKVCCPDSKGHRVCNDVATQTFVCIGGAAIAEVRQQDGKVLSIRHEK